LLLENTFLLAMEVVVVEMMVEVEERATRGIGVLLIMASFRAVEVAADMVNASKKKKPIVV
jgi:hypothetical protein